MTIDEARKSYKFAVWLSGYNSQKPKRYKPTMAPSRIVLLFIEDFENGFVYPGYKPEKKESA